MPSAGGSAEPPARGAIRTTTGWLPTIMTRPNRRRPHPAGLHADLASAAGAVADARAIAGVLHGGWRARVPAKEGRVARQATPSRQVSTRMTLAPPDPDAQERNRMIARIPPRSTTPWTSNVILTDTRASTGRWRPAHPRARPPDAQGCRDAAPSARRPRGGACSPYPSLRSQPPSRPRATRAPLGRTASQQTVSTAAPSYPQATRAGLTRLSPP